MSDRQVIATELLKGQGLGNQLFCYVTTRCLAMQNRCGFAILNKEILANNIHSNKGMYQLLYTEICRMKRILDNIRKKSNSGLR